MKKVLVVEDEPDINEVIVHHLSSAGFEVAAVLNGDDALGLLEDHGFDLAILDIILPGMNGWELCRNIRQSSGNRRLPVIFLSALSSEADRVKGFDLGCDDYLIKPFSPREMVSRVKAILRRSEQKLRGRPSIRAGELHIDLLNHQVRVSGKTVHLTSSEFQVLNLLAANEGRVYSREELLSLMRENGADLELGNVDVHVHRLRQKIEQDPRDPRMIQTVWGVGYRFTESQ